MNLCQFCDEPSDGKPLCQDCIDGVLWARSKKLQQDYLRRELQVTDWGIIVCEVEALLERSPEMRCIEDKVWSKVLESIHPIWGKWTEAAYQHTRELLCEYLFDHLGKRPGPCSKPTPEEYRDWLWVVTEIVQFIKDNPSLREVEPECWEWMLNQTYPLPPNHAPTARGLVKPTLENFMGDYGPTVQMILEMEGRTEAPRLAKVPVASYPNEAGAEKVEQQLENIPSQEPHQEESKHASRRRKRQ